MMGCFLSVAFLCAQSVTLTFTGSTVNNQYIPLNRVIVSNLTKGWQETLTWPDTVLVMSTTGIHNVGTFPETSLQLSQNTPNPFNGTTFVNLQVTEPGDVTVTVTDITGRLVAVEMFPETSLQKTSPQQPAIYQMRVSLSLAGTYFLTAQQNGHTASVKMVNNGEGGANNVTVNGMLDMVETPLFYSKPAPRGTTDNPFDLGDQMEYVGFAMLHGLDMWGSRCCTVWRWKADTKRKNSMPRRRLHFCSRTRSPAPTPPRSPMSKAMSITPCKSAASVG